jgi:hypothetical protein
MSEWISVKDRLPLLGREVRIRLDDTSELQDAIWQSDGDWWWGERFFAFERVTHWMPLPDPPQPQP